MEKSNSADISGNITFYQALLDNSEGMFLAAKEDRWDDLIDLDLMRAELLNQHVSLHKNDISAPNVEIENTLIQQILECDKKTKILIEVWQKEIKDIMGALNNERKLADVYQSSE
jgi:hypothetical protein